MLIFLRDRQDEMTGLLQRLIELESPTNHKPSLDRLGAYLADQARELGAQVEVLPQTEAGDHVLARWGGGDGGMLLLCHMDTVWNLGTVVQRPVRIEGGRLYGAGAMDMKGGIVVALEALGVLRAFDRWPECPITLLLTSDEETGSATSRPTIEAQARQHQVVFVLEPAQPPHGSLKTSRKGVGEYRLVVRGRAAHAGADHAQGINAAEELAHQILTIQGFTDYAVGTTFNVGVVGGGTRRNVVPAEAWAEIDVRIAQVEEAARVATRMESLAPHLPGVELEVTGGVERPPMVRTPQIAALYAQAESLARGMGLEISEAGTGGASDGNLTAALGVPTLDGMGAVGEGGHSVDEYALLASLPERAALLAAMLRSTVPGRLSIRGSD
jgi:glutamate carboxypeptidase